MNYFKDLYYIYDCNLNAIQSYQFNQKIEKKELSKRLDISSDFYEGFDLNK